MQERVKMVKFLGEDYIGQEDGSRNQLQMNYYISSDEYFSKLGLFNNILSIEWTNM